jgi:enoyl-CoA hydratase/carnithine racemase
MAGRRLAARYLLLGEAFGVDEALSIGLVSHRAPPGECDVCLNDLVERLLAKPPEALRQTQWLLRHGERDEILERMRLEGGVFAERLQSPEVKEAISAFFEKRRPNFPELGGATD